MRRNNDHRSERSVLEKAIRDNAPLIIERQLRSGHRLKDSDLFLAVNGQTEALKFLLEKGLNANTVDASGNNLLYYINDAILFEFILGRIDNIDHQNLSGNTISHHLIEKLFRDRNVRLIDLCLARKPNLALRNKGGRTVLLSMPIQDSHEADTEETLTFMFSPNYFTIIDRLLASGSSLAETDAEGNTLLHRICKLMKVDRDLQAMIEALVERGAPINAKNHQGVSVLAQLMIRIEIEYPKGFESVPDDPEILGQEEYEDL
jgi:ankyrin repeat protein